MNASQILFFQSNLDTNNYYTHNKREQCDRIRDHEKQSKEGSADAQKDRVARNAKYASLNKCSFVLFIDSDSPGSCALSVRLKVMGLIPVLVQTTTERQTNAARM